MNVLELHGERAGGKTTLVRMLLAGAETSEVRRGVAAAVLVCPTDSIRRTYRFDKSISVLTIPELCRVGFRVPPTALVVVEDADRLRPREIEAVFEALHRIPDSEAEPVTVVFVTDVPAWRWSSAKRRL